MTLVQPMRVGASTEETQLPRTRRHSHAVTPGMACRPGRRPKPGDLNQGQPGCHLDSQNSWRFRVTRWVVVELVATAGEKHRGGGAALTVRGESPASHRGRRGAPLIHPTA